MTDELPRCRWARRSNPRYVAYHDHEWGVPCIDETRLFEMLNLEGAQAGLSWETILDKRENYRRAFDRWDPVRIAAYGPREVGRLLADPGIVRNRLKIESTVSNARAYLALQDESGGLVPYLWSWVGGVPIVNRRNSIDEVPSSDALSEALSGDLKRRGFRFVGPTVVYAWLQAVGVVDDHAADCFKGALGRSPARPSS